MQPFFVYMLRCGDGTLYVGHTDDLQRRVAEHEAGVVPGYTAQRPPVEFVWAQETATRDEALAAEMRIKGWRREKKEALIAGDWERIKVLARSKGLRQAQPERGAGGLRQAQPERGGAFLGPEGAARGLRQAQPERGVGVGIGGGAGAGARLSTNTLRPRLSHPAHPEPVEGPRGTSPRQQPAPDTLRPYPPHPAHPEPVEGPGGTPPRPQPALGKAFFERGDEERAARGLRQAQPERGGGGGAGDGAGAGAGARLTTNTLRPHSPHPAHPEPVEGPGTTPPRPQPAPPETDPQRSDGHAPPPDNPQPPIHALVTALTAGHRRALAKSITLLESTRPDHRAQADILLNAILPRTGRALRLGISGVPGVGKSTFIEALGLTLIAKGHRVAVLAIDPSSSISGGSILGDKTRMDKLSVEPAAYIRPSPASGTLGGVAEKTREAMLVCEAAAYDVVIVETVGVGQSETAVASMTDMFVLLQLPNAGDDLQAIKKGVMELADLVVINKADLDPDAATRAEAHVSGSLRLFGAHAGPEHWVPRVMQLSALKGQGIDTFWAAVEEFHRKRHATGAFEARRKQQALAWMWDLVHARLHADFRHHPAVRDALAATVDAVTDARIAPSSAARTLLTLFAQNPR